MKPNIIEKVGRYMKDRGADSYEVAMFIRMCKKWKPESMFRSFRGKERERQRLSIYI